MCVSVSMRKREREREREGGAGVGRDRNGGGGSIKLPNAEKTRVVARAQKDAQTKNGWWMWVVNDCVLDDFQMLRSTKIPRIGVKKKKITDFSYSSSSSCTHVLLKIGSKFKTAGAKQDHLLSQGVSNFHLEHVRHTLEIKEENVQPLATPPPPNRHTENLFHG